MQGRPCVQRGSRESSSPPAVVELRLQLPLASALVLIQATVELDLLYRAKGEGRDSEDGHRSAWHGPQLGFRAVQRGPIEPA